MDTYIDINVYIHLSISIHISMMYTYIYRHMYRKVKLKNFNDDFELVACLTENKKHIMRRVLFVGIWEIKF